MENNKCSYGSCELEVYEDSKECVLHCEKNDYSTDWNSGLLFDFYTELKIRCDLGTKERIIFTNIFFPATDNRDSYNWEILLNEYLAVHFQECKFSRAIHIKDDMKCFFETCTFYGYWILQPWGTLWNINDVIYQCCIFKEDVSIYSAEDRGLFLSILYVSQFDYTCTFKKELRLDNTKIKKPLFNISEKFYNEDSQNKNICNSLIFNNCIFEQPFKLNNYKIEYFMCKDTVFKNKSKFEFKNNEVNSFQILNTNFKSLVDCFDTKFEIFEIKKSIFEKFTGFENCSFAMKNKKDIATFEYATFLDFVNFREAKFDYGLNLKKANFKLYPNFLDIEINNENTNRETFRIIKYSFDTVGNNIEANKYFAYEMREERENPSKKDFSYKLMLDFNYLISDFGQSWIRPFSWIIYFLCLQFLVFCLMDNWKFDYGLVRDSWIGLNQTVHDFMPFKKFLVTGKEFVSLIFLIIYSTLIYNFVVAVKRITKR